MTQDNTPPGSGAAAPADQGPIAQRLIPHASRLSDLPPGLPYPHQADGVVLLMSSKRSLLGDDMGLGKTR
jgi:hypothetical protein